MNRLRKLQRQYFNFYHDVNKAYFDNKLIIEYIYLRYAKPGDEFKGMYYLNKKTIFITDIRQSKKIFLHELSHAIQLQIYKKTGKPHDKFFWKIYNKLKEHEKIG